ncbi:MAG: BatD family protein [Muribaculaceae bacterium]
MKRCRIFHVVALMLMMCGFVANAAEVTFSAQGPRQVVQGNRFSVVYVLRNGEGSGFQAPDIEGAQKIYGPAMSTSYSQQWVNGVSSSSSSVEYTMTYKAVKAGKYNVGPASVNVDGKKLTTKPFTIEILPPDKSAQAGSQTSGGTSVQFDDPTTQEAGKEVSSKDLFVRISMSKSKVYEQEAVVCTIKLYTKYQISQFMPTLQPSFNGFLIEDLPLSPSLNQVERLNGENYMVAELKKCILFPQQSGKLTITSGNYDVTVVQYEKIRTMFGIMSQPVEKKLKVKSNSASVMITPLPTPKPATFSGAVGKYSITSSINPLQLKTYEAASYNLVVRGSGNIKYIKAPTVPFPSQFEVYDPQSKISANPNGSTVSGSVTYDYTFIPQFVGKYTIPKVDFTYFDTEQHKYVTVSTTDYNLTVAKGSGAPASHKAGGIEQKNRDILHIKLGDLHLEREHKFLLDEMNYWLCYILPILFVAGLLFYHRKSLKERTNIAHMRTKRANKVAQKRLKTAKKYLNAGDSNNFYAETLKACWGYLSDKLGIPVSELSKDNIQLELENYGVDEDTVNHVLEVLNKCEFAQYAPELSGNDMATVLDEAGEVMDRLENIKKRK